MLSGNGVCCCCWPGMGRIHSQPICRDISLPAGQTEPHIFHSKMKEAALRYLCCFTSAWPSREPGQHWWNREKGIRAVLLPFIHAEVPAVCLIQAIRIHALDYFLGRVREAAVKVASLCLELGAHGNRLPVPKHTVEGRGTTHKKWVLVMTAERVILLQCPDPVVLTSKASWNAAEPLWDVLSPWKTMSLLLSCVSSGVRRK